MLTDATNRRQFEQSFAGHNGADIAAGLRKQLDKEQHKSVQQAKKLIEIDIEIKRLSAENTQLRATKQRAHRFTALTDFLVSNRSKADFWIAASVLPLALVTLVYALTAPDNRMNLQKQWERVILMTDKGQYTLALQVSDSLLKSNAEVIPFTMKMKEGRAIAKEDFLALRAYAKSELKNDTGAIKDYTAVVQNPICRTQDAAYRMRGRLKLAFGDTVGALNDYNHSIRLNNRADWTYWDRAEVFYQRKGFSSALVDYKKAVELDGKEATTLNSLANCYYAVGRRDSACVAWRKSGELGNAVAYDNIKNFCR